jgi:hypothetical protein
MALMPVMPLPWNKLGRSSDAEVTAVCLFLLPGKLKQSGRAEVPT